MWQRMWPEILREESGDAGSGQAPTKLNYVVDGVKKEIPIEEAIARLQKAEAAEERFRVASELRKEAEELSAKYSKYGDLEKAAATLRSGTPDDPQTTAAFKTVAGFLGATDDDIAQMLGGGGSPAGGPPPSNPRGEGTAAAPAAAPDARQAKLLGRMQSFFDECAAKGIDPVAAITEAQNAADDALDGKAKKIVADALDKDKILGTITRGNEKRRGTILRNVTDEVFRRIEQGGPHGRPHRGGRIGLQQT